MMTVLLIPKLAQKQQSCTEASASLQVTRRGNKAAYWLCRWQLQCVCSAAKAVLLLLHYRPDLPDVPFSTCISVLLTAENKQLVWSL